MSDNNVKNIIGKVFNDIADAMETGQFADRVKVGVTLSGSELGIDNIVKGAETAQNRDPSTEVVLIGPKVESKLTQYNVEREDEQHKKMEELLDKGEIDACVTMHYNFPIGVSTVGRIVTPGQGREMFLATTTGTSSLNRIEAMIKNGIYGIIAAKAMGVENPSLGILNLDGAMQVERAFKELSKKGYEITFAESGRSDGGALMRGNDLLTGEPDVMINDTLTGNILMKVFSSYTTGGSYESQGFGYGPGIGEGHERTILIISRASGVPVVSNALLYAASLVRGNIKEIAKREFEKANKAGLKDILKEVKKEVKKIDGEEEVKTPSKETVTSTINGIDIMELEDAVGVLWKEKIYAESGMGCTGPIILVNESKSKQAIKVLAKAGYKVGELEDC